MLLMSVIVIKNEVILVLLSDIITDMSDKMFLMI